MKDYTYSFKKPPTEGNQPMNDDPHQIACAVKSQIPTDGPHSYHPNGCAFCGHPHCNDFCNGDAVPTPCIYCLANQTQINTSAMLQLSELALLTSNKIEAIVESVNEVVGSLNGLVDFIEEHHEAIHKGELAYTTTHQEATEIAEEVFSTPEDVRRRVRGSDSAARKVMRDRRREQQNLSAVVSKALDDLLKGNGGTSVGNHFDADKDGA